MVEWLLAKGRHKPFQCVDMRFITFLFAYTQFLGYYLNMKRATKRKPKGAEEGQRGAGAMANATRGMARRFKNRKKDAARKACRGKHES